MIPRQDITGIVLAGGRGSRMGGIDKGLQAFRGGTLAGHSLARLAPQVGPLLLNANRNLAAYGALGVPVLADTLADHAGPLAGMLAGLLHCQTGYLASVPCDTPLFPADLVARLSAALLQCGAEIAMAAAAEPGEPAGALRPQPVFCLLQAGLAASLTAFLQGGGRRVHTWTAQHHTVLVPFAGPADDAAAFTNANTLAELRQLDSGAP